MNIREKLLNTPSYFKKGNGWLANKFKTSPLEIQNIRKEYNSKKVHEKPMPKLGKLVPHTTESISTIYKVGDVEFSEDFQSKTAKISTISTIEIKTIEDLQKACNIDLSKYEITQIWYGHSNDRYKVSCALRKKESLEVVDYVKAFEEVINKRNIKVINSNLPKVSKITKTTSIENKCLVELAVFDLHMAKLSWSKECGENYDINIAKKIFIDSAINLIEKANNSFNIDKILLPLGNDLFNVDNKFGTTTAGTPQDSDVRWQKMFSDTLEACLDVIDYLKAYAPVDVLIIPGNHDEQMCYFLGSSIKNYYRKDKDVDVENEPRRRKYYRYGATLLGFTHGNEEKHANLPQIMAIEARKDWAEVRYTEFHLGHFHTSKATNFNGMSEYSGTQVRILPSLSASDAWHSNKGYIGNERRALALVYDKEHGKIAEFTYTV
jgi:hypothetical protein